MLHKLLNFLLHKLHKLLNKNVEINSKLTKLKCNSSSIEQRDSIGLRLAPPYKRGLQSSRNDRNLVLYSLDDTLMINIFDSQIDAQ